MKAPTMTRIFIPVVLTTLIFTALFTGCNRGDKGAEKYFCPMHPTYITYRPGDCPICGMRLVPMEEKEDKPGAAEGTKYTCPMHPEVVSDKPGKCPKCGMNLEPMEEPEKTPPVESSGPDHAEGSHAIPSSTTSGERKVLYYRNPMSPEVTSPVPMKDEMGMDYVAVYSDEIASQTGAGVEGLVPITVSNEGFRLAGVQVATATRERLVRTIRTVGYVTPDETRVRHIHTKIAGWIEKLEANFTGQWVEKDSPILTIYSPELMASQQEYLTVLGGIGRGSTVESPDFKKTEADLISMARRRLELFDVPGQFIDTLEKSGEITKTVTLIAPSSGFITTKDVFEGQQVEPGMELFTITDLSHVWIEGDFYEYEAAFVKLGQRGDFSLPYGDIPQSTGAVSYISPTLSPDSRTLKVRFEMNNPKLLLKPSMYVDVDLQVEAVEGVVIPDSSVLDSGQRKIVFVDQGKGRYEPREVSVGIRDAGKAQILDGIQPGERVVIRANFLLDSESRLQAAFSGASVKSGHPH
jgi:membrane fusion protein, copper/silver efflux system